MRVQIDEPGRDGEPAEVDLLGCRTVRDRDADRLDPVADDPEVTDDRRAAGPVVDARVPKQQVDHSRASAPDVTYPSHRPHRADVSTSVTASP